ncbi:hypothetical protein JTB14_018998 [Gonioctena quinquepunctata]|nr:hypothetical protein JTB14_018998 [Gonioctena quinquepunctata]
MADKRQDPDKRAATKKKDDGDEKKPQRKKKARAPARVIPDTSGEEEIPAPKRYKGKRSSTETKPKARGSAEKLEKGDGEDKKSIVPGKGRPTVVRLVTKRRIRNLKANNGWRQKRKPSSETEKKSEKPVVREFAPSPRRKEKESKLPDEIDGIDDKGKIQPRTADATEKTEDEPKVGKTPSELKRTDERTAKETPKKRMADEGQEESFIIEMEKLPIEGTSKTDKGDMESGKPAGKRKKKVPTADTVTAPVDKKSMGGDQVSRKPGRKLKNQFQKLESQLIKNRRKMNRNRENQVKKLKNHVRVSPTEINPNQLRKHQNLLIKPKADEQVPGKPGGKPN